MKKLISLFLTGLGILLPVALSLYLIYWLFTKIDNILGPLLEQIVGQKIPGIGFILTIFLIILVGLMATNILGRKLFLWWEKILVRIPLLGKIYSAIKKITKTFLSPNKMAFNKVVLVEFPRLGAYSIGFITNDKSPLLDEETYSVFVPTTPNPTSGFFIIVPRDKVRILDITVDRAFEMIMSAGMVNE